MTVISIRYDEVSRKLWLNSGLSCKELYLPNVQKRELEDFLQIAVNDARTMVGWIRDEWDLGGRRDA